jgi:hypothetical protein
LHAHERAEFVYPDTRGGHPKLRGKTKVRTALFFRTAVADPAVQGAFSDVVQFVKPFDNSRDPDIRQRIEACAETQNA